MSWFWELDAAWYAFPHCVQLRSLQRSTKAPTIQLLCALLGWSLKFQFGPKSSESTKIKLISNWYWKCDICVVDHSGGKNTRNKHHKVYTINIDKLYIYTTWDTQRHTFRGDSVIALLATTLQLLLRHTQCHCEAQAVLHLAFWVPSCWKNEGS